MNLKQLIKIFGGTYLVGSAFLMLYYHVWAYGMNDKMLIISVHWFGEAFWEIYFIIGFFVCGMFATYWLFLRNERFIEDDNKDKD